MLFDHGVFTSEAVSSGHPDKLCDQISDAILDAFLTRDPNARVACETLAANNQVTVVGEVRTLDSLHHQQIEAGADRLSRDTIRAAGYGTAEQDIDPDHCDVSIRLNRQSPEIASAVEGDGENLGAGDQGIVFGHATDDTPELMPLPWVLARDLLRTGDRLRREEELPLRPDAKSQVMVRYRNGQPVCVTGVVLSWQHETDWSVVDLRDSLREIVVDRVIPTRLRQPNDFNLRINPAGAWTQGGPRADAGLTGRKIVADTYGGACPHGGGAFSGKDSSKIDRSAAYAARHIARNVVAAGLARRCTIEIAYAIGKPAPVALRADLHGTGAISEEILERAIPDAFDLSPAGIHRAFDLRRPIYAATARYGHFGTADAVCRPWERNDRIEDLLVALRHHSSQSHPASGPSIRVTQRSARSEPDETSSEPEPSRWHTLAHDELTDAPGRMEERVFEVRYLGGNTWDLSSGGSDFLGDEEVEPETDIRSTDSLIELLATFDEGWEPQEWERRQDDVTPLSPLLQSLREVAEAVGAVDCVEKLREMTR